MDLTSAARRLSHWQSQWHTNGQGAIGNHQCHPPISRAIDQHGGLKNLTDAAAEAIGKHFDDAMKMIAGGAGRFAEEANDVYAAAKDMFGLDD